MKHTIPALAAALVLSGSAGAQVVISQVYSGSGASGTASSPWTHDFVELFNQGSTPVSLAGFSIQYGQASGVVGPGPGQIVALSGTVPARGYFLVQLGAAGSAGSALPSPDASSTNVQMGTASGKVALVGTTTPLNSSNPVGNPAVLDFVGYGSASASETAPVGGLSDVTSAIRKLSGCTDSGHNLNDFVVAPSKPRNSACGLNFCSPGLAETRTDTAGHTPTLDGLLGTNEYGPGNAYVYRGDGTDFSGMIGWSPTAQRGVYFASDDTGVNIALSLGTDISADNTAVILLNTRTGGVPSATLIPFDNGDATQRAIGRALQCAMPAGFEADYAVGINRFGAYVYGVATGGMIFVNSATTFGTGTSFATVREMRIPYSALVSFVPGTPIDFIATINNGAPGPGTFMSNESVPPSAALNSSASPGNTGGAFTNYNRFVTACGVPMITVQPTNAGSCMGTPAGFSVTATGTALTYQWRKGTVPINGANSATHAIATPGLGDVGTYDCVVTGACGVATSNAVTLSLDSAAPVITQQPTSAMWCYANGFAAGTMALSVIATGTGLNYDWQAASPESPNQWTSFDTRPSFTITSYTTTLGLISSIRCVVTNGCGSATSSVVTLSTGTDGPSIISGPADVHWCRSNGVASGTLSMSVAATGGTLTYAWESLPYLSSIALSTGPTLSVPLSTLATGPIYYIRCIVTSDCGSTQSGLAVLTVGERACAADFDCSGNLAVADIFAFLNAWFAGDPSANFDGTSGLQIADIFAFLNAWFAGC